MKITVTMELEELNQFCKQKEQIAKLNDLLKGYKIKNTSFMDQFTRQWSVGRDVLDGPPSTVQNLEELLINIIRLTR